MAISECLSFEKLEGVMGQRIHVFFTGCVHCNYPRFDLVNQYAENPLTGQLLCLRCNVAKIRVVNLSERCIAANLDTLRLY